MVERGQMRGGVHQTDSVHGSGLKLRLKNRVYVGQKIFMGVCFNKFFQYPTSDKFWYHLKSGLA